MKVLLPIQKMMMYNVYVLKNIKLNELHQKLKVIFFFFTFFVFHSKIWTDFYCENILFKIKQKLRPREKLKRFSLCFVSIPFGISRFLCAVMFDNHFQLRVKILIGIRVCYFFLVCFLKMYWLKIEAKQTMKR
jgi:hypothetical protein